MKKQQDHILWTLESKSIEHLPVDITDPRQRTERDFMRERLKDEKRQALPPQLFKDEEYIGVSANSSDMTWTLLLENRHVKYS